MIVISDAQKKLLEGKYVAFATVDRKNSPNLIVVEVNQVIAPDKILITDNFFNKTRTNLLNNSSVSLSLWLDVPLTGFQFKGVAQYYSNGKYSKLTAELNPGLSHKGYVIITVTEIWDLADPKLICQQ